READDRVLELVLSRPVPRALWYASRLLAAAGLALVAALAAALPLLATSDAGPTLAWAGGLACELVLLVAAAMACAVALRQVPAACAAVAAFYVLGRSIAAISLMSGDAAADTTGLAARGLARAVD